MKIISLEQVPDEGVTHDPQIKKRVLLKNGVVPHLTNFSCARLTAGQKTARHAHQDMAEIFFVESGEGTIEIGSESFSLAAGTCVLVEPKEDHTLSAGKSSDLVVLYFGIATT